MNKNLEERLQSELTRLENIGSLRALPELEQSIDFSSNDYLELSKSGRLLEKWTENFKSYNSQQLGATGARLISGNSELHQRLEQHIAEFHNAESALIFNSGYDANIGLLSAVPQKGDTIIYDEYSHASLRDGIRLSTARSYSFTHNCLESLKKKLDVASGTIFIVVESLYSMDGDLSPLSDVLNLADSYNAHVIVDEAHSSGIYGEFGQGYTCSLNCEGRVWARIHTFGKAFGCHGAAVVGSSTLKKYLINKARSFIYSTSLDALQLIAINSAYELIKTSKNERKKLSENIQCFLKYSSEMTDTFSRNNTAIQYIRCNDNTEANELSLFLKQKGIMVAAIRYPTVPKGQERIRICLHSSNTEGEIVKLVDAYRDFKEA